MLLLFLAVSWLCRASELIAPPCPLIETSFQCVDEGADCHADVRSNPFQNSNIPNTCAAGRTCRICKDDSLVCYLGQCIKRTQGVQQSCNPNSHNFCLAHLQCSGSCLDPAATIPNPGLFAQVGEACDPAAQDCLSNLNCNVFTSLCEGPPMCNDASDCAAHEYCASSQASSDGQSYCKKMMDLGSRAGAMCSMSSSGECGLTYGCAPLRQAEPPHDDTRAVCTAFYSIATGHPCIDNIYCASGYCKNNFCAQFDFATLGDACGKDSECQGTTGQDTVCSCPRKGGQRMRCVQSQNTITLETQKNEYFKQKPYLECLEMNGCNSINPRMGSCAYKNCRDLLNGVTLIGSNPPYVSTSGVGSIQIFAYLGLNPPRSCGDYWEAGIVDYKGWEGIRDSAASTQASFLLVGAIVAFLLSMF